MHHSDQIYIDALLTNNTALIDDLYKKFSEKIKWMILKNKGNEADAEDIFQEALVAIYNRAKKSKFELTCPLDAYLYTICRNMWRSMLRKKNIQKVTFTDTERYIIGDDAFEQAEDLLLLWQRRKLMYEKIEELGKGCKELLRLSWLSVGMEEVARLLNVTYGYARKRKSECTSQLETLMQ